MLSMTTDDDIDDLLYFADDCECDTSHSVAKLGHCRDCPSFDSKQATMIDRRLSTTFGCPPQHLDGTEHDFEWATYSDERDSYGVCRCGHDSLADALWSLP